MKAEQARAYEAMKGQFEGLLGRLQVHIYFFQKICLSRVAVKFTANSDWGLQSHPSLCMNGIF